MHRLQRAAALAAVSVGVMFSLGGAVSADTSPTSVITLAATGQIQPAVIQLASGQTREAPFISDGPIAAVNEVLNANDKPEAADAASVQNVGVASPTGTSPGSVGCSGRDTSGNKRVNQDCSFRRQAEEDIVFNPATPTNLLAGQNDSRLGFNQCGIDFSTDSGNHWGDMIPPFRQRVNNPGSAAPNNSSLLGGAQPSSRHTYDAGSDPTVAFDSAGRGFFGCLGFDLNDAASLLYVTQSPAGAGGSFFFNVPQSGRTFIATEDNDPQTVNDKEFIVADTYASSPNRDNVYVTWTVFTFTGGVAYQQSPIYGSMSIDHARTWSKPQEISGSNASLCFLANVFGAPGAPDRCDFDQGSDPIVLPNGDLVVVFNNGNTAPTNPNSQQLAVRCHPVNGTTSLTSSLNCDPTPTFVGDDVTVGEPRCSFGRECIPGAFIRTNDYPRIAVRPSNGHLYVVWQDYRNKEFDIQLTESSDGGITWAPSVTANPDTQLDHYFPAVDLSKTSTSDDRVGVSYYRTERVASENSGATFGPGAVNTCGPAGTALCNSDYVLAGGTALQAPFVYKVVSPVFPPPDGIQAGFNGDYSGLTIPPGNNAQPIWSDTRNVDPYAPANGVLHDEDIFTDNVGLPNGTASPSVGQIGK